MQSLVGRWTILGRLPQSVGKTAAWPHYVHDPLCLWRQTRNHKCTFLFLKCTFSLKGNAKPFGVLLFTKKLKNMHLVSTPDLRAAKKQSITMTRRNKTITPGTVWKIIQSRINFWTAIFWLFIFTIKQVFYQETRANGAFLTPSPGSPHSFFYGVRPLPPSCER